MAIPKESRASRVLAGAELAALLAGCSGGAASCKKVRRHRTATASSARLLVGCSSWWLARPCQTARSALCCSVQSTCPRVRARRQGHRDSGACLPLLVPLPESACCQLRMDGREPVNSRTMSRRRIALRRATPKLQRLKPVTPNAPMMKPPITPTTIPIRMSPMSPSPVPHTSRLASHPASPPRMIQPRIPLDLVLFLSSLIGDAASLPYVPSLLKQVGCQAERIRNGVWRPAQ